MSLGAETRSERYTKNSLKKIVRNIASRRISGFLQKYQRNKRNKMAFTLNPYEKTLNLRDKDDRKLFESGRQGLDSENKYDGSPGKFSNFRKLIRKLFENVCSMDAFEIATHWDESTRAPRVPDELQDVFLEKGVCAKKLEKHVKMVWSKAEFGNDPDQTPNYFASFSKLPTNTNELGDLRNAAQMKHVMIGKIIWNSLKAPFQIELMTGEEYYTQNGYTDGILLWDYLVGHVNPSTKVSVANLKDELENCNLNDHNHDVKAFNQWFSAKKAEIVREVGKSGYTEYIRCLFKAYRTARDKEFLIAINNERRDWMLGKLPDNYSCENLLALGLRVYNNQVALKEWEVTEEKEKTKAPETADPTILALFSEFSNLKRAFDNVKADNSSGIPSDKEKKEKKVYWRFSNPENKSEMKRGEMTYKWCSNDCHRKFPMWCNRANCMNRAEYKEYLATQNKKGDPSSKKVSASDDFKLALSTITSQTDFEVFKDNFLN